MNHALAARLGLRLVTLFEDGVWIGEGELSPQGTVLECRAPLSDTVFDAIEDAIESGEAAVLMGGHRYTWRLN